MAERHEQRTDGGKRRVLTPLEVLGIRGQMALDATRENVMGAMQNLAKPRTLVNASATLGAYALPSVAPVAYEAYQEATRPATTMEVVQQNLAHAAAQLPARFAEAQKMGVADDAAAQSAMRGVFAEYLTLLRALSPAEVATFEATFIESATAADFSKGFKGQLEARRNFTSMVADMTTIAAENIRPTLTPTLTASLATTGQLGIAWAASEASPAKPLIAHRERVATDLPDGARYTNISYTDKAGKIILADAYVKKAEGIVQFFEPGTQKVIAWASLKNVGILTNVVQVGAVEEETPTVFTYSKGISKTHQLVERRIQPAASEGDQTPVNTPIKVHFLPKHKTLAELKVGVDAASFRLIQELEHGTYDVKDLDWSLHRFNGTTMVVASDGRGFQTSETLAKQFFAAYQKDETIKIPYFNEDGTSNILQFSGDGKTMWRHARDVVAAVSTPFAAVEPTTRVTMAAAGVGQYVAGKGLDAIGVKLPNLGEYLANGLEWAAEQLSMKKENVTADDVIVLLERAHTTEEQRNILNTFLSPEYVEAYKQATPEVGKTLIALEIALQRGDKAAIADAMNTLEQIDKKNGSLERAFSVAAQRALQKGVTAVQIIANPGDSANNAYAVAISSEFKKGAWKTKTQLAVGTGNVSAEGSTARYWGAGLGLEAVNKDGHGAFVNIQGLHKGAGNTVETATETTTTPAAFYFEVVGGAIVRVLSSEELNLAVRAGGGAGVQHIDGKGTKFIPVYLASASVESNKLNELTKKIGIDGTAIDWNFLQSLDKLNALSLRTKVASTFGLGMTPDGMGGLFLTGNIDLSQISKYILKRMQLMRELNFYTANLFQTVNWQHPSADNLRDITSAASNVRDYLKADQSETLDFLPDAIREAIENGVKQKTGGGIPPWVREKAQAFVADALVVSGIANTDMPAEQKADLLRGAMAKLQQSTGAFDAMTAAQYLQSWGSGIHWGKEAVRAGAAGQISPADAANRFHAEAQKLHEDSVTKTEKPAAVAVDALTSFSESVTTQDQASFDIKYTVVDADGVQNVVINIYSDAAHTAFVKAISVPAGTNLTATISGAGITAGTTYYPQITYEAKNGATGQYVAQVQNVAATRTLTDTNPGSFAALAVTGGNNNQTLDAAIAANAGNITASDLRVVVYDGNTPAGVLSTFTPTYNTATGAISGDFTGYSANIFDPSAAASWQLQQVDTIVNGVYQWTNIGTQGSIN